jgi:hypothetical protein
MHTPVRLDADEITETGVPLLLAWQCRPWASRYDHPGPWEGRRLLPRRLGSAVSHCSISYGSAYVSSSRRPPARRKGRTISQAAPCLTAPVNQTREYYTEGEFDTCDAKMSAFYLCLESKITKDPDVDEVRPEIEAQAEGLMTGGRRLWNTKI